MKIKYEYIWRAMESYTIPITRDYVYIYGELIDACKTQIATLRVKKTSILL